MSLSRDQHVPLHVGTLPAHHQRPPRRTIQLVAAGLVLLNLSLPGLTAGSFATTAEALVLVDAQVESPSTPPPPPAAPPSATPAVPPTPSPASTPAATGPASASAPSGRSRTAPPGLDPPAAPLPTISVAPPTPSAETRPKVPLLSAPRQTFLTSVGSAARAAQAQTSVPASVTVAQAILESDWGRSLLSVQANNYFGVKATSSSGAVLSLPTTEYDAEGQPTTVVAAFRVYADMAASVLDHDLLLARLARYAPAMAARSDPRQFARLIAAGGYATDPAYADKLIALMDQYALYQYDA